LFWQLFWLLFQKFGRILPNLLVTLVPLVNPINNFTPVVFKSLCSILVT
jgi:hypothetical protein